MKKFVLLGVMAAAVAGAGVAAAQPSPPSPPAGATPEPGRMGDDGRHGQMHGGMHGGRHGRMMEMMRPPSKAARFHFSRDDAEVDIKCADDEPMRACADAASVLIDKLAAQPSR